jgi:hypothetical protein
VSNAGSSAAEPFLTPQFKNNLKGNFLCDSKSIPYQFNHYLSQKIISVLANRFGQGAFEVGLRCQPQSPGNKSAPFADNLV